MMQDKQYTQDTNIQSDICMSTDNPVAIMVDENYEEKLKHLQESLKLFYVIKMKYITDVVKDELKCYSSIKPIDMEFKEIVYGNNQKDECESKYNPGFQEALESLYITKNKYMNLEAEIKNFERVFKIDLENTNQDNIYLKKMEECQIIDSSIERVKEAIRNMQPQVVNEDIVQIVGQTSKEIITDKNSKTDPTLGPTGDTGANEKADSTIEVNSKYNPTSAEMEFIQNNIAGDADINTLHWNVNSTPIFNQNLIQEQRRLLRKPLTDFSSRDTLYTFITSLLETAFEKELDLMDEEYKYYIFDAYNYRAAIDLPKDTFSQLSRDKKIGIKTKLDIEEANIILSCLYLLYNRFKMTSDETIFEETYREGVLMQDKNFYLAEYYESLITYHIDYVGPISSLVSECLELKPFPDRHLQFNIWKLTYSKQSKKVLVIDDTDFLSITDITDTYTIDWITADEYVILEGTYTVAAGTVLKKGFSMNVPLPYPPIVIPAGTVLCKGTSIAAETPLPYVKELRQIVFQEGRLTEVDYLSIINHSGQDYLCIKGGSKILAGITLPVGSMFSLENQEATDYHKMVLKIADENTLEIKADKVIPATITITKDNIINMDLLIPFSEDMDIIKYLRFPQPYILPHDLTLEEDYPVDNSIYCPPNTVLKEDMFFDTEYTFSTNGTRIPKEMASAFSKVTVHEKADLKEESEHHDEKDEEDIDFMKMEEFEPLIITAPSTPAQTFVGSIFGSIMSYISSDKKNN